MIAEILAKNPKYLIFDEPTTMIDSIGKEKIYKIIGTIGNILNNTRRNSIL